MVLLIACSVVVLVHCMLLYELRNSSVGRVSDREMAHPVLNPDACRLHEYFPIGFDSRVFSLSATFIIVLNLNVSVGFLVTLTKSAET